MLSTISSLLPTSAFLEETSATGLAIQRAEDIGPVEFLNLATFMISNNFPGDADAENLREWFANHNSTSLLKALSSMEGPTVEVLLENLFRFAVEAEDLSSIKYLLNAGLNPNGHACRQPRIYEIDGSELTPLQLALIRGNTELARELIKAGSTIDHPNTGWKSSALVLAIIGENLRGNNSVWSFEYEDDEDEDDEYEDTRHQNVRGYEDYVATQEATDRHLNLINSLIEAGAAINLGDVGHLRLTEEKEKQAPVHVFAEGLLGLAIRDMYSPLTAASKFRSKDLVDLFLKQGADVMFQTDQGTSALHDCLYDRERTKSGLTCNRLHSSNGRHLHFPKSESWSKTLMVARRLLDAGANVNEKFMYCSSFGNDNSYNDGKFYTILDLGVITGRVEVVDMLLSAGAHMTESSVENAIEIESLEVVNYLINAGARVSTRAAQIATEKGNNGGYVKALFTTRQDIHLKRAAMIEAIRLRDVSLVEYLFKDGTLSGQKLLHGSVELMSAIETSCSHGDIRMLRLILEKSLECQFSIAPWLGQSIYLAVLKNHSEVVDALLSAGANVHVATTKGETALIAAIKSKNKRMVTNLINAGGISGAIANPTNICFSSCIERHSISGDALIAAIESDDFITTRKLFEAGADIMALGSASRQNCEECQCITPLTAAVKSRNPLLADRLICAGAAINNPPGCTGMGLTPLLAAVRNQDFELVQFLINRGANPYCERVFAEATTDFWLLKLLLKALHNYEKPADSEDLGCDALHEAIKKQDLEMAKAILSSSLIESTNALSFALSSAITYDSSPSLEITHMLLSLGADPNAIWHDDNDFHGTVDESALVLAVQKNNLQQVQILLGAGAQPDRHLKLSIRFSPLQRAVKNQSQDIVRKLLSYGSDPNAVSLSSLYGTPVQMAVAHRDLPMLKILLQHKGNPCTIFGELEHTPLQMASRDGSREMVELLLEHGAYVNSPPAKKCGATALQFAAMQGYLGIANLLLEYGADVHAPAAEIDGRTALEGAAEHGRIDMVKFLLNADTDIFGDGQSQYENAVRRASENGHHSIRRLLQRHHR